MPNPEPKVRTIKIDYWKAVEMIGEDEAAKFWEEADADREEELEFDVEIEEPIVENNPASGGQRRVENRHGRG